MVCFFSLSFHLSTIRSHKLEEWLMMSKGFKREKQFEIQLALKESSTKNLSQKEK